MNHKLLLIVCTGILLSAFVSCRKESDPLMAYDHDENLVFKDAETSFAAKFDVLWNGMNQYYSIWDYELEMGTDWDAIYTQYRPKFEALDKRADDQTVTNEELLELMRGFLGSLHDGHLQFSMLNHKTGSVVWYAPNTDRIEAERDDVEASAYQPSIAYYANPANGEIETDAGGNPIAMACSTQLNSLFAAFSQVPGVGSQWILAKIAELEALPSPTDFEAFQLQELNNLRTGLSKIGNVDYATAISMFNSLQAQYAFLQVPGFDYIDPAFAGNLGIDVQFALLKGNIAYLRLSGFYLTPYLEDAESQKEFNMSHPDTQQLVARVRQVWQAWFDSIQQLHKSGALGGVIIDVRSNGGGNMNDSKYVVGALVPSGDIRFGYQRFKRGTGRFEYSAMMPAYVASMSQPHEIITEPIVILTNCRSVSMSETSVLCVKTLSNGIHMGKRSWGAICPLTGNEDHSFNYAGLIGVEGVTPVYGHVPSMASFTLDNQLIESKGLTPDIEVDLDVELYKTTGRDTQLDRALQYLRK